MECLRGIAAQGLGDARLHATGEPCHPLDNPPGDRAGSDTAPGASARFAVPSLSDGGIASLVRPPQLGAEADQKHPCMLQTWYQTRVHADHCTERDRLITHLQEETACHGENFTDEEFSLLARRERKLRTCCEAPVVRTDEAGQTLRLCEARCRDRLCPRCNRFRAREVTARITRAVTMLSAPKFLTLTLRHRKETLADMLARLRDAFRELRRRRWWKTRVRAAVYTVEIECNPVSRTWHAHVHAIIDADFIPQKLISDEWLAITKDSFRVHIRPVYDRARDARYISSYVAKSSSTLKIPGCMLTDYVLGITAVRVLATCGELHGVSLRLDEIELPKTTKTVIDLNVLAAAAANGDPVADGLIKRLSHLPSVMTITRQSENRTALIKLHEQVHVDLKRWIVDHTPPPPPPPRRVDKQTSLAFPTATRFA